MIYNENICNTSELCINCLWVQDDDGVWESGCGHMFEFNDGDPADNYFAFCPYCGKHLEIININK
jgi:hypothetical protein